MRNNPRAVAWEWARMNMIGIKSYGVHIPLWRLDRKLLPTAGRGEKAIAGWDEDSITMAVAAAQECLQGTEVSAVDGVYFASTTSPYREKLSATTVAASLGLRDDIITADFGNSLRAGTTALMAASDAVKADPSRKILVVAADCRLGAPGSAIEQDLGDGAAALLVQDGEVGVEIEDSISVTKEILDVWRADDEGRYISVWEDRWVYSQGYLDSIKESTGRLLKKHNLSTAEVAKVALYGPNARQHKTAVTMLGLDTETQVQAPWFTEMGNTGCALPLMLLGESIAASKKGDCLIVVSYGNGSDAILLKATGAAFNAGGGVTAKLTRKMLLPDYLTYLKWRGITKIEGTARPPLGNISSSAMYREREQTNTLAATKCQVCGSVQYPPQRICINCHATDQYDKVSLADKTGTVHSYTKDYLSPMQNPLVIGVINFEGGGRTILEITDIDPNSEVLKVGMKVRMCLRRVIHERGRRGYYWKAVPAGD